MERLLILAVIGLEVMTWRKDRPLKMSRQVEGAILSEVAVLQM